jgi:uncharacterized protein (TIGR03083 family)
MTRDEYIAALRANAHALGAAARSAPLDTRVPSCPEWSLRDLVGHVGSHYRWVGANLTRAPDDGPQPVRELPPSPGGESAIEWLEQGAEELASALEVADLDAPCWTFGGEQKVAFWCRRTTQETAVHRWDAQNAASGAAEPIDPALAADGIDEWLGLLNAFRGAKLARVEPQTIHLHCTDEPGEWLLSLDASGMQVTPEHAKGDVAARGTASDLLLMLLGRKSASDVEVFGDAALLDSFLEHSSF